MRNAVTPCVLILLSLAGCSRDTGRHKWSGYVPFVPVIRQVTGELEDRPQMMKSGQFRIGLAIVLSVYDHEFIAGKEKIFVPPRLLEGMIPPEYTSPYPAEFDEADYRANLTAKSVTAGQLYRAVEEQMWGGHPEKPADAEGQRGQ